MKRVFILATLLWLGISEVYGMEEFAVEDSDAEMYAQIGSQILLMVLFTAPAVAIGSLFAFMRFDKAHKSFLESEVVQIDSEIDKLRDECMQIDINPEAEELQAKIEILKKAYEGV